MRKDKGLLNYLKESTGVIHVGAHRGQEADIYSDLNLPVVWIEAIPDIYDNLVENIKQYDNQIAINALLTDVKNKKYKFNISFNDAKSSSIFQFRRPGKKVKHISQIKLKSDTLENIYDNLELLSDEKYNFLVLDVQGSELLVLKGGEPILNNFDYIYSEYTLDDTPMYKEGVLYSELKGWLGKNNFFPINKPIKKHGNILFKRGE